MLIRHTKGGKRAHAKNPTHPPAENVDLAEAGFVHGSIGKTNRKPYAIKNKVKELLEQIYNTTGNS